MNWLSSAISGGAQVISALIGGSGGDDNQEEVEALEQQIVQQNQRTKELQSELSRTRQYLLIGGVLIGGYILLNAN